MAARSLTRITLPTLEAECKIGSPGTVVAEEWQWTSPVLPWSIKCLNLRMVTTPEYPVHVRVLVNTARWVRLAGFGCLKSDTILSRFNSFITTRFEE